MVDAQGKAVAGAAVHIAQGKNDRQTLTDTQGFFAIKLDAAGSYDLTVVAPTFQPLSKSLNLVAQESSLDLQLIPLITRSDTVTVTADVNAFDVLSPDPAEKVFSAPGSSRRQPWPPWRAGFHSWLSHRNRFQRN